MEKKNELKVGDKYLSISLFGGQIKLAAFKNKNKEGSQPDYRGDGIAIWVNQKKENPKIQEEQI